MSALPQRIFHTPFESHTLVGDIISSQGPPRVLALHGAGRSDRSAFNLSRTHFWTRGISSAAFDFVGHGETGGILKRSSLKSRTEQACRVIDQLQLAQPLSIMATSMGAYTAVKLLEQYTVAHLILLVPAMYTAKAYDVPFGQGFTELIRGSKSWEQSDAWAILSGFTGRLLIVAGERDAVIPPGVIQGIYNAAEKAESRDLYVAPDASHYVITDLRAKHADDLHRLFVRMADLLTLEAL